MHTESQGLSSGMSTREKNLHKRRITKEHNSNFRAGYVHINEEYLHKTGIRGRKKYIVYTVLIVMGVVAVLNIFITWTIMGVLSISKDGMGSLEFVRHSRLLRFLTHADIGEGVLLQNSLFSLKDRGIDISGLNEKEVVLRKTATGTGLIMGTSGLVINSTKEFSVTDPESGKMVFSSDFTNKLRFPQETKSIRSKQVVTNRVVGPAREELRFESEHQTVLRGAEGLSVEAKEFTLSAKDNVDIRTNERLTIDGKKSIYLDQVKTMATSTGQETDASELAYRLCVCMPHGKVFAVPAPYHCDQANEIVNPCLE